MASTITVPPSTMRVDADGAGECFIPDVFGPDVQMILAGLDFTGTWARRANLRMAAQELRGVATAARALADSAEEWAQEASPC